MTPVNHPGAAPAPPPRGTAAAIAMMITGMACFATSDVLAKYASSALPVAEATALAYASPLFITILCAFVLREHVDRVRWMIVGAGFCGVLMVMQPGSAAFQPVALLPVAASMAWAVAVIFTRKASGRDGVATTMLHSSVIGVAVLSALTIPLFRTPTPVQFAALATMGLLWSVAQWLMVASYHRGDASKLAPFAYSQLLWASLFGYVVFGHVPDAIAIAGILVILGCGALAGYREAQAPAAS
jgi:drug/metabolite transporter (DMT)-like permease